MYEEHPVGCSLGVGAVILVVLVGLFVWWGGTWTSVPPDKIALHYTGGPFQGVKYKEIVPPGTGNKYYGQAEKMYMLPVTQRDYLIDRDPEQSDTGRADFITAPSKDRTPFTFEVAVYFKLNSDEETIRDFFEEICLKLNCTDLDDDNPANGKGWDALLQKYLRPQLDLSVAQAAKQFTREELYGNAASLEEMNDAVAANLKDAVNRAMGGQFFCGPNSEGGDCEDFRVVVKDPQPPKSVVDAYAATAAAQENTQRVAEQGKAKIQSAKDEAEAQRQRAEAPPLTQAQIDFIKAQAQLECAQNSNCTLVVTSGDTPVNVNAGG